MNTKYVSWAFVIGLVFGGFIGYVSYHAPVQTGGASANVTASNALDQQSLVNELNLIANPLTNIEEQTTASLQFGSLTSTSTTGLNATTTVLSIPASLGDSVLVNPVTPTAGVQYDGFVSVASTTGATITITAANDSGATVIPTSTTFNIVLLPFASFKAPVGL